ncbi:hypothetical protein AAEO56_00890 [Flavobacterium sp. DGU11]|uniref:Uncharacterized protein n=1 Tax=Flavobacterium arundinis TaxID=3139143 RepID=A0ABU9HSA3_9FLAO
MTLQKRGKEENYYKKLQDITLERLEQLCGKKWTDFNVHDPGITIADYFNYGLFELQYRLGSSLEAYLQGPGDRSVPFGRIGLLPKEELFEQSIVTRQDYENLILRQDPAIKKCIVLLNKKTRLYDIFLGTTQHPDENAKERLAEIVRQAYHSNRNLCEDLGEIRWQEYKEVHETALYPGSGPIEKDTFEYPEFETVGHTEAVPAFSPNYNSIQFDFPEAYGIGERGLPTGITVAGKSKILQMKAYMLIFDHMMADTLSQAGSINELLEFSGRVPGNTIPDVVVPEWEHIVDKDLKSDTILHGEAYYGSQKNLYFNVLDILYGENTANIFTHDPAISQHKMNEKRANLILRFPWLNSHRFLSFNIYDTASTPTIQQLIETLIDYRHMPAETGTFGKYGLRVVSDKEFYERYKFLQNTSFAINIEENALLEEVEEIGVLYDDRTFHKLRMNINLLWYNVLFESFLKYGDEKKHYKILTLPDEEYLLVFRHPEKGDWINMGLFFKTKEKLVETANLFWQFIRNIKHREVHTDIYFIEHLLLRHGHGDDRNKLSVIISEEHIGNGDRTHIEWLLEERLPAHIRIKVFYIQNSNMQQFKHIYTTWRKALAAGHREDIDYASIAVRAFLSSHVNSEKSVGDE